MLINIKMFCFDSNFDKGDITSCCSSVVLLFMHHNIVYRKYSSTIVSIYVTIIV